MPPICKNKKKRTLRKNNKTVNEKKTKRTVGKKNKNDDQKEKKSSVQEKQSIDQPCVVDCVDGVVGERISIQMYTAKKIKCTLTLTLYTCSHAWVGYTLMPQTLSLTTFLCPSHVARETILCN